MIIRALRIALGEEEIAGKLREGLSSAAQLKDVTVSLAPGVVQIGGKFQVGFPIPFDTQWALSVLGQGRQVGVRLTNVSVGMLGVSASMATSQIMGALAQKLQGMRGVSLAEDMIVLDLATLLEAKGVFLRAPVNRVEVGAGCVEIDIG